MTSGYSLYTNCSFGQRKSKFDCYQGEDCMEKIFKYLRDHATTKKQQQQQQQQNKYCYRQLIKKISLMKSKNFATYVKKNLILIKMIKMHLNYIIKSEIVVII